MTARVRLFSLFLLKDFKKITSSLDEYYVKKKTCKKKRKNISERRDPATTTATADPGRASREQRAVTKVVVAALAVFSLSPDGKKEAAPVGVPPEGDEPTGHEDESQ